MIALGAKLLALVTGEAGKGLLAWFLGPVGRYVAIMIVAALAMGWAYHKGAVKERGKCDTASLQAELRIAKADLRIARNSAADSLAKLNETTESERKLMEKQSDLESELAKRPPAGACIISPADARHLR